MPVSRHEQEQARIRLSANQTCPDIRSNQIQRGVSKESFSGPISASRRFQTIQIT